MFKPGDIICRPSLLDKEPDWWPAEVLSGSNKFGDPRVRKANGDETSFPFNIFPDLAHYEGPKVTSNISKCTCTQLLYGCNCGLGAIEIAASTGRTKNPVTGLWE